MTVITYKNGILASDTLATNNSYDHSLKQQKIYIVKNEVYAFTGTVNRMNEYLDFIKGKIKILTSWEKNDIEGICINLKTKKKYQFQICGNYVSKIEFIDDFVAFGWGRQYAKGAMEMGADAITAIEVACKYTICQSPIYYIDINEEKPTIKLYKNDRYKRNY